ncbi:hypothetical protein FNF31_04583 [Cafeteria roenbergensis]|uniref:Rad21/Rec8-like protein N-terminal domain-containing protein n=1 Tax=Cafeteria roenbergensis TaxID=33653 RepID=A0A5A8D413_CAFRO|nr:hypothetical protein FNF31_04583 [Cafeteria roenbergensis]
MFYSQLLLQKKTHLGRLWLAAHWDRSLSKQAVANVDISDISQSLMKPKVALALRVSGQLLLGLARIYSRKVTFLFADCSDALSKIQSAFRVADLDLPKDKTTGGNAINLAPGAAGLDASALHDLDSAWQGADLDADLDAQYGGAAGAGLLQGAGGNDLLFGAGDGMDMYGAGEFTEALGGAADDYEDDYDGGASVAMMGLGGGSTSLASRDHIEALRGEGFTPGAASAARSSMGMAIGADMLQAPGRGSLLGVDAGAAGARASVGDDAAAFDAGDLAPMDGGFDGMAVDGGFAEAGYGADDDGGFGGIAIDGMGESAVAQAAGPDSALRRSTTVEEMVPGGLATAEALSGRRAGIEDDDAVGDGAGAAASLLSGAAPAAGRKTAEEVAAAREKAAATRRQRLAKRARRAMGDTVMSSDTFRGWLRDGTATMRPAVGPSMAVRRMELACGRGDDFTAPSGEFLVARRPDDALRASLGRSAVAGLSTSSLLMSADIMALLSAAGGGNLSSRTARLGTSQRGAASRFLARKLAEEAARRGGRSGAIVSGSSLQAARVAAGEAGHGAAGAAGAADGADGASVYGAADDYAAGDLPQMDDGFGGMDMGGGFAEGMDADAASEAGLGAGGAAASVAGRSELPSEVDEGVDTESLLGDAADQPSAAKSALRAGAGFDEAGGEDGDDAPERAFAGRAGAAAAGGDDAPALGVLNSRTARMLGVIDAELASQAEAARAAAAQAATAAERRAQLAKAEEEATTLRFHSLVGGHSRRTAAVAFYEALVLKNDDVIDMAQARAYGGIAIRRGPRYAEALERAAAAEEERDSDSD